MTDLSKLKKLSEGVPKVSDDDKRKIQKLLAIKALQKKADSPEEYGVFDEPGQLRLEREAKKNSEIRELGKLDESKKRSDMVGDSYSSIERSRRMLEEMEELDRKNDKRLKKFKDKIKTK